MSITKKLEKIEIALKHLKSLKTPTEADLQLLDYLEQLTNILESVDVKYKEIVSEYLGYCKTNRIPTYTQQVPAQNTSQGLSDKEEGLAMGVAMAAVAPEVFMPFTHDATVEAGGEQSCCSPDCLFVDPDDLY